ncbi:deleted in oral cancer 1/CDK2-associated protein, putative [Pediculus humanus corporis]|uniref:Deleted in oral cancer 1/CDK2-associated protein, putative n=1 Tax=Pediculus humanus subsp. corporis TaxID=121224 RepID=E0VSS3_PEDHC|nr:deleted in oral cancer 1/CDK2-associated protein, putative [Pediculus humanus corporis]EEB16429.1 deleted in oral cancer 1/CDK2-associated protein, putative [Pediculus humanus corporis]
MKTLRGERNISSHSLPKQNMPKYTQLLSVIEDMGKEVRTAYAGNKTSVERLKKGIVQAKHLVGECLIETERSARQ